MGGKAILLVVSGVVAVSGIIFFNMSRTTVELSSNSESAYLAQTAKNVAQSGASMGLRQLTKDSTWRAGFANVPMFRGKVTVTVVDTTFAGIPAVAIRGQSVVGNASTQQAWATSTVFVRKEFQPPFVRAALQSKNPISINGNYTMDGRDHTPTGVLIPNSGTLAVWTTSTFSQGGSFDVGGTAAGVDYVPSRPGNTAVIKQNQPWSDALPGTPDSVFGGAKYGFPEGTLKAVAKSGVGGSQYTTDPNNLMLPLNGVTYVELSSGSSWRFSGNLGTGLLIVHNSAVDAGLSNKPNSSFTGLIIADNFDTFKGDITGAVVTLSPSGSTGGNANGSLLYSSAVIKQINGSISPTGTDSKIIAWKE